MKFRDFIINNKHYLKFQQYQEEVYKWCVDKINNLIYSDLIQKN